MWGQLIRYTVRASLVSVHPHGCGDNARRVNVPSSFCGSPPRVWGQLFTLPIKRGSRRFTPTGVGTTGRLNPGTRRRAVHPHGCGDNASTSFRARRYSRFTPTGVGTTPPPLLSPARHRVHPHGCGDNIVSVTALAMRPGSPPRVWGQPPVAATQNQSPRFTPTGVGTTLYAEDGPSAISRFTPTGVGTTL